MDRLGFRMASAQDVDVLARMNRDLIVDEGSRNPMDLLALAERMRGFILGEYRAILILVDHAPAGYCLYQTRCDEYDPEHAVVYVRQYFVKRDMRREGIGRRAFERIAGVVFPDEATLELDVLASNKVGQAFWASLGFRPHLTLVKRRAQPVKT